MCAIFRDSWKCFLQQSRGILKYIFPFTSFQEGSQQLISDMCFVCLQIDLINSSNYTQYFFQFECLEYDLDREKLVIFMYK